MKDANGLENKILHLLPLMYKNLCVWFFSYMPVRRINTHIWKEKLRKQHQTGNSLLQMNCSMGCRRCLLFCTVTLNKYIYLYGAMEVWLKGSEHVLLLQRT